MDINKIAERAHNIAVEHGWYDDGQPPIPERLALIHSEVSEALEAYRNDFILETRLEPDGNPGGKPVGFWTEIADVVIRCFDLMVAHGVNPEQEITRKMDYNGRRPYRHGGKRA